MDLEGVPTLYPLLPTLGAGVIYRSVAASSLLLFLAVLVIAGCSHTAPPNGLPASGGHPTADLPAPAWQFAPDYVGDQACAKCHSLEFKKHLGGRHAKTLRP